VPLIVAAHVADKTNSRVQYNTVYHASYIHHELESSCGSESSPSPSKNNFRAIEFVAVHMIESIRADETLTSNSMYSESYCTDTGLSGVLYDRARIRSDEIPINISFKLANLKSNSRDLGLNENG